MGVYMVTSVVRDYYETIIDNDNFTTIFVAVNKWYEV